jgi:hypothetical protein
VEKTIRYWKKINSALMAVLIVEAGFGFAAWIISGLFFS